MNVIALSRIALCRVLIRFKYTILAYLYVQTENVIMQLCKLVFHIPLRVPLNCNLLIARSLICLAT